jgi:hypothetical protein
VNGVAAKVAQEIRVLFEHYCINPGASEKQAKHHPRRPAADDAAPAG